jgi:hypothetical protein
MSSLLEGLQCSGVKRGREGNWTALKKDVLRSHVRSDLGFRLFHIYFFKFE